MKLFARFLFVVTYVGALCALVWYWNYALQHHPRALIALIAIGGIPIGFLLVRAYNKEDERGSVWTTLTTYVKRKDAFDVSPNEDEKLFGAGAINGVRFRALSIYAFESGIRIERPFQSVGPIDISWKQIQRLDLIKFSGRKTSDELDAALIVLRDNECVIVVYPWPEYFDSLVPDHIGKRTHHKKL